MHGYTIAKAVTLLLEAFVLADAISINIYVLACIAGISKSILSLLRQFKYVSPVKQNFKIRTVGRNIFLLCYKFLHGNVGKLYGQTWKSPKNA